MPPPKTLFRQALDNTLQGLWGKLPWFFAAVAAMLILTSLDSVRTNYDIRAGSAGRPIEISDEFLKELKPKSITSREEKEAKAAALKKSESTAKQETEVKIEEPVTTQPTDETLWKWLSEPYRFRYQKFANRRALLDALAAKAMVVTGEGQAALRKQREEALEKQKKLEEEASVASRNGITPKAAEIEEAAKVKKDIDDKIAQLDKGLGVTTTYVYTTFSDSLPQVLLTVQHRKPGLLDDLLSPILNEQSSLSVVYQVFRLTALIVLILSFVFILVMLIQHTPFAGETETVSTQLKTLISLKSAGVAGEIAKTAIISVTALGVGTAIFVGATAPDTSAVPRVAGNPGSSVSETIRERFREIVLPYPGGQTISDPVAEEYFLQTLFSERNRYSYFYDLRQSNNGPSPPPPNFNPTILPAPVEVRMFPGGDSQALPDELRKLVTKVNSASDLTQIKLQIAALQTALLRLNTPDCQCKEALSGIAAKLETLNSAIGGNIPHPATTASPTPSPSPSTPSPTTIGSPASTPTPTPSILGRLGKTVEALDAIEKDLKGIRADNLSKVGPSTRNLATRTGQLFGSEYYLVSEQTYLALEDLLKGHSNYDAFTGALTMMKNTQPPLEKGRFLSTLRKAMTKAEQEALKPWEKIILSYARLRR